ncbi:MAG: phospho-2-dehydro-3-deoxyheptonate aldolase [Lactobacillus sp.]|jgi:DhnA family fructose-bisphosphate aldolase class Ia|nr:phospho-2-dehydro-3-deoxyheptonate aldolase [Lactobacillus sp.]MCH3906003.1 phospho-2-dehydro-3-deoxyheptonate aldolase [Lactobacillus sp.]MCH3990423.1 phospho-2-dehydro-3-deoxyheptonate aldolase [Lactobacillus sp.]MCH4068862.1 phospho-2-dehydro-3-deoxyheptonate aldolase [Lactobacillus sp.]MCI1329340.1 phospho-2-dehydro-3-deoxyheptonate aldolase [Lactobacillus sp.]
MDKARRLNHIFGHDGKTIIVALDGFGFSDHTDGVDYSVKNVKNLVKYGLNCALVTYGQAQMFEKELVDVPIVLRVDGNASIFDSSVPTTHRFFDVTDALKLGADGVVCMPMPGSKYPGAEIASYQMISDLAKQGQIWNMPVLAETLPISYAVQKDDPHTNDPHYIATAARLGAEYGADIIKTRFTGDIESDKKIVQNAKRPCVALGGPKTDNKTYFEYVHNLMEAGVKGIACGRNITQDPNPVGKVAALSAIIHEGKSVEEALKVYNTVQSEK